MNGFVEEIVQETFEICTLTEDWKKRMIVSLYNEKGGKV